LLVYFTTMGPETNQGLRGPGHDDDEAAKVQNQVPHHCDAEETLVRNHLSTFIAHNQISLDDILKLVHMSEWIKNTSGPPDPLIKNANAKTQQGSVPNIEMDIAEMYEEQKATWLICVGARPESISNIVCCNTKAIGDHLMNKQVWELAKIVEEELISCIRKKIDSQQNQQQKIKIVLAGHGFSGAIAAALSMLLPQQHAGKGSSWPAEKACSPVAITFGAPMFLACKGKEKMQVQSHLNLVNGNDIIARLPTAWSEFADDNCKTSLQHTIPPGTMREWCWSKTFGQTLGSNLLSQFDSQPMELPKYEHFCCIHELEPRAGHSFNNFDVSLELDLEHESTGSAIVHHMIENYVLQIENHMETWLLAEEIPRSATVDEDTCLNNSAKNASSELYTQIEEKLVNAQGPQANLLRLLQELVKAPAEQSADMCMEGWAEAATEIREMLSKDKFQTGEFQDGLMKLQARQTAIPQDMFRQRVQDALRNENPLIEKVRMDYEDYLRGDKEKLCAEYLEFEKKNGNIEETNEVKFQTLKKCQMESKASEIVCQTKLLRSLMIEMAVKINESIDDSTMQSLNRMVETMEKMAASVTFAGPTKAGKSTMLNALLGEQLAPSDVFPMTVLPMVVQHTPHAKKEADADEDDDADSNKNIGASSEEHNEHNVNPEFAERQIKIPFSICIR